MCAVMTACGVNLGQTSSAEEVISEIERVGKSAVQGAMWNDDNLSKHIICSIASGRSEWLSVAAELKGGSYAHVNEELSSAAAAALIHATEAVLRLPADRYYVSAICAPPGYSYIQCVAPGWRLRAAEALAKVEAPELKERRDQCLAVLAKHQ